MLTAYRLIWLIAYRKKLTFKYLFVFQLNKPISVIMDNDAFIAMIHNNPGWNNLTRKGTAFIVVPYKNVDFVLFRNDVNHFLRVQPQGPCEAEIINEFNELLESCRFELSKELDMWDGSRLTRDDNEADPIK